VLARLTTEPVKGTAQDVRPAPDAKLDGEPVDLLELGIGHPHNYLCIALWHALSIRY